jgi:hypothetical protein
MAKFKFEKGEYEGDANLPSEIPHGKGKITYDFGAQGKTVYEGYFVDGKYHGKGKITWNNGAVYEGDFANDEYHGKGKFTNAWGTTVYEGDFVNGKYHGKGELTDKDCTFEGEFVNGRQHEGKCTYADGRVEEGYWCGYKYLGKEIPHQENPIFIGDDEYEGEVVDGKPHGKGRLKIIRSESFVVEGEGWKTAEYIDAVYEGDFVNGKKHGKGKMTYADGKVEEGEWKDGEFVHS